MNPFKEGDYVVLERPEFTENTGVKGKVTEVFGAKMVEVEVISKPEASWYHPGFRFVVAVDKLERDSGHAEEKLAKIVGLLEQIEATSDTTGVESEWLKGNYYGASNTAKAIRQILDA